MGPIEPELSMSADDARRPSSIWNGLWSPQMMRVPVKASPIPQAMKTHPMILMMTSPAGLRSSVSSSMYCQWFARLKKLLPRELNMAEFGRTSAKRPTKTPTVPITIQSQPGIELSLWHERMRARRHSWTSADGRSSHDTLMSSATFCRTLAVGSVASSLAFMVP